MDKCTTAGCRNEPTFCDECVGALLDAELWRAFKNTRHDAAVRIAARIDRGMAALEDKTIESLAWLELGEIRKFVEAEFLEKRWREGGGRDGRSSRYSFVDACSGREILGLLIRAREIGDADLLLQVGPAVERRKPTTIMGAAAHEIVQEIERRMESPGSEPYAMLAMLRNWIIERFRLADTLRDQDRERGAPSPPASGDLEPE